MNTDHRFMDLAIFQAKRAADAHEVPVGAVITCDGEVIATGFNHRETSQSALAHAEMLAIAAACEKRRSWRLDQCTLYVTLEPCPMCAGAIMNARISRVVFGAFDPKAGACGSVFDLFTFPVNHRPEVVGSVKQDQCAALLIDFFKNLRNERK